MSEVLASELAPLIPVAIKQLGRIPTLAHAAKVLIEAIGVLFTGHPKCELPMISQIAPMLEGLAVPNAHEVPPGSLIIAKASSLLGPQEVKATEGDLQAAMNAAGIKAKVKVINGIADLEVLAPPAH